MLLFSPPCCTVQVYFNRNVRKRQKFDVYLIDDEGVRLSQVWQAVDARLHALGGLTSEVKKLSIWRAERWEDYVL